MSEGFGAGDREPPEEQWWPGPTPVEVCTFPDECAAWVVRVLAAMAHDPLPGSVAPDLDRGMGVPPPVGA